MSDLSITVIQGVPSLVDSPYIEVMSSRSPNDERVTICNITFVEDSGDGALIMNPILRQSKMSRDEAIHFARAKAFELGIKRIYVG